MRQSDSIAELTPALAKAQAVIEDPEMNGTVLNKNGTTRYTYAFLADVLKVCRAALGANGIFLIQSTEVDRNVMLTRLIHSSGEWLEVDYPMAPRQNDPQQQGSANTYARRYSLMSLMGIAGERDDDGEGAKGDGKVDTEALRREGSANGRNWLVKEYLAKPVDGFSGAGFAGALKKAKINHTVEHVKMWCLWLGKNKPSRLKPADLDNLIKWLGSAKGKESWKKFVAACGPLRKKGKKAADEPPGDQGWTRTEADEFKKALKGLDWSLDEIGPWCVAHKRPHPSAMDEETRDKLLTWLATDVETDGKKKNGGDEILAWMETQKEGGEE